MAVNARAATGGRPYMHVGAGLCAGPRALFLYWIRGTVCESRAVALL